MDPRDLTAVAALADASRRAMLEHVRRAGRPLTRDEIARHLGVSRKLAAFHLEKLVEVGLLRVSSAPPAGPRGPGRTPKAYEPSDAELAVAVPPRRLDLMGEVLADAVAASPEATAAAVDRAAARGRDLGARERAERGVSGRTGAERAVRLVCGVLEELGAEPFRTGTGTVRMRNCPFHPLAAQQPALVCGMHRALVDGVLRGLGNETVEARLAPLPGQCCVEVVPPGAAPAGG